MKKSIALFAATFLFANLQTEAQILKDVFGGKKEKAGETTVTASAPLPGANQYKMLEYFLSFKKVYPMGRSGDQVYYTGSETPLVPTTMLADIKSDGNRSFKYNGVAEFEPNHATEPTYFFKKDGSDYFIFTDKYAFRLDRFDVENNKIIIFDNIYAYNKADADAVKSKKVNIDMISAELTAYLNAADVARKSELGKEAEVAKAADDAQRAIYSIKGKSVKSIAIECSASELAYRQNVSYTIAATLADGKVLKAGSGEKGYLDDYVIEILGVENHSGTSLYLDYKNTPKDVVTLKVTSAHHTNISTEKTFNMQYKVLDDSNFGFTNKASTPPFHGQDSRVEMKQVKHALTGAPLIVYKIFFMNETTPIWAFRASPETPVRFRTDSGIMSYNNNDYGKTGGDAGALKIIIDPSVVSHGLTYSAKGAPGEKGKIKSGETGRDGKIEVLKQAVNW